MFYYSDKRDKHIMSPLGAKIQKKKFNYLHQNGFFCIKYIKKDADTVIMRQKSHHHKPLSKGARLQRTYLHDVILL